jgi:hypothetical protein
VLSGDTFVSVDGFILVGITFGLLPQGLDWLHSFSFFFLELKFPERLRQNFVLIVQNVSTANRVLQGSLYIACRDDGDALLPQFADKYVLVFRTAMAPVEEPNSWWVVSQSVSRGSSAEQQGPKHVDCFWFV